MNDLVVTQLWMSGVVLMMAVYGGFALVGYYRHQRRNPKDDSQE